jgi:hypothetical protein
MKDRRPELPRGLCYIARSPFIFFSWRDPRGRQHMQSTRTSDPVDAMVFKREFLELKEHEDPDEKVEDLGKLALHLAAERYFEWKGANCSPDTIDREQRMFKNVLKFFGRTKPVRSFSSTSYRRCWIRSRRFRARKPFMNSFVRFLE